MIWSHFNKLNVINNLVGHRVTLCPLHMSYSSKWVALRQYSAAHLRPWEPLWVLDTNTSADFERRLRFLNQRAREGSEFSYLITHNNSDALIGGLTISNIRKGSVQTASVGYWLGLPYLRNGYMTEAVVTIARHCFTEIGLNRLEAACVDVNKPSIKVLMNAGFSKEGFARAYRCINGKWRDHLLFGMVAGDPLPSGVDIARGRK